MAAASTATKVPSTQGTWYSSDGSIALHGNTITTSDGDVKLYRRSQSFVNSDEFNDSAVQEATKDWGVAHMFSDVAERHGLGPKCR